MGVVTVETSFNPRTRAGCDTAVIQQFPATYRFQSTHPRGVRLQFRGTKVSDVVFQSTHPASSRAASAGMLFQSTHPAQRLDVADGVVSIHAPRAGCDGLTGDSHAEEIGFNPRTPRGVRLESPGHLLGDLLFQSTHPARGATFDEDMKMPKNNVSIHAPRAGCDVGR